jgi:hypothetical protein
MVRPALGSNPFGPLYQSIHGAVAQLGERYNGIVEVVGSIPSGSTNSWKLALDWHYWVKTDLGLSKATYRTQPTHNHGPLQRE